MPTLPCPPRRADRTTGTRTLQALIAFLLLVSAALLGCQQASAPPSRATSPAPAASPGQPSAPRDDAAPHAPPQADTAPAAQTRLPRLLDLGAGKCIPCKRMAPILEELKEEYAGSLEVVFIDVWEDRGAGQKYGIQMIPTQIFYDSSGKELFRHEGFLSKEDILAKWKDLGIELQRKPPESPPKI